VKVRYLMYEGSLCHLGSEGCRILWRAVSPSEFSPARAVASVPFLLPAFVLAGFVVFLYLPVLSDLAAQWITDPNYSHGFLIPIISGYLMWERRAQLQRCLLSATPWGYAVLLAGLVLLVLGQAATFGYAARLSLLVVTAGLILFLAGPGVLKISSFPLLYLLFMIPPPATVVNQIAFPLQLMAAKLATASLDLLNVPVLREGNIITLVPMRLEVTEACSGIRSLIALVALGVIFAYFTQKRRVLRVAVALSAIPIALATNAARITLTGVLVEIFGPRAGLGFYHTFSGFLIFILAFALLAAESLAVSRMVTGERS
jgi:exosortase